MSYIDDKGQIPRHGDKPLAYDTDIVRTYLQRGMNYHRMRQYQYAIGDYTTYINVNPGDPEAYFLRGQAFCTLEQYQSALEDFDRAIQHDRNDSWVFYMRGICFLRMENYQKAIEDFKQALCIDPENEDTRALLESAEASNAQTHPETEHMGTHENQPADDSMESLTEMHGESYKRFSEGELVAGKIISVDKDYVLVDVGYKSEGQIRVQEFMDKNGNINAALGDSVEVMVEYWDEEEERVILSREKAAKIKAWEAAKKAYDENETVKGVIVAQVKGGYEVDIGVPAFLPGSQANLRPVRNPDDMIGRTFRFQIVKYNRRRSNIVLSRRVFLETEREEKRAVTLATLHEGKVVDGIVKNIKPYGAFVDIGGMDGLMHIKDISWGRIKNPAQRFAIGDEIRVLVLKFDAETERISLGMKQLTPDPWHAVEEKYPAWSNITGTVVNMTDFGAFVEIEQGVDGLLHISKISESRRISHPSEILSIGDQIRATVLNTDPEKRRISLRLLPSDQLQEDAMDEDSEFIRA